MTLRWFFISNVGFHWILELSSLSRTSTACRLSSFVTVSVDIFHLNAQIDLNTQEFVIKKTFTTQTFRRDEPIDLDTNLFHGHLCRGLILKSAKEFDHGQTVTISGFHSLVQQIVNDNKAIA